MAAKTKQLGVRLETPQVQRLETIAERYQHTPAGLIRLAVDQFIKAYDADGQLPTHQLTDRPEAAAAGAHR